MYTSMYWLKWRQDTDGTKKGRRRMKKLALLMAFLLALSALGSAAFAEENKYIDVLRVAVPSIPASLDPATGIGNNNLMMYFNIYDTIIFNDSYHDGSLTSYIC